MHLEGLIEDLGGLGLYQRCVLVLSTLFMLTIVPTMLMMVFAGVEPDWWCHSYETNGSMMVHSHETNGFMMAHSHETNGSMMVLATRNVSFQNCDRSCQRMYSDDMRTIVSEWDLACDMKWVSSMMISVQMAGVLIGAAMSGHLADTYGRKKTMYGGLLMMTIGNFLSVFSASWVMFAALRVLLGVFVGIALPVLYPYQIEFVGRKWRGLVSGLPEWAAGVIVFAFLVWAIRDWKWIHMSISILCVPILLTWFIAPESVRWLTVKGRLTEARYVINKMAAWNRKDVPDTSILDLIAAEERLEGNQAKSYSYRHLFKRSMVKKTLATCFIWFCLSLIYYAISFGTKKLAGDFYSNLAIMAMLEVLACPLMIAMAYIFGRRWACAWLLLLAAVTCFGVVICSRFAPEDMRGELENGFAIAAKTFTISAWGIAQALCSEQYPTVIRNLAVAAQNTAARVGGIIAAQIISLGDGNDLMPSFLSMGILLVIIAILCFALEETRYTALEDTMVKYTPSECVLEVQQMVQRG